MRIEYLAAIRLPTEKAHGLQIMKTCEALAGNGAEVELVVPSRQNPLHADPFPYYGVRRNFTLATLPVPDLVRFGMPGFLLTIVWFSEAARFRKSFRSADILYSRDALILFQYILLGRKVVYEAHAKPSFAARFVARRAHRVVVISQGLKDAYADAGVLPERIIIAPDAVDAAHFSVPESKKEARTSLGLPEDVPILLYAGHLYTRKGADTLAKAAHALSDKHIVFVGGTDADVVRFKAKWGAERNIVLTGHVPPGAIPRYLSAADVLVLPNSAADEDSARFSSPMKLFEYMASGTPIVASDVPAIREILDDKTANFFSPDDPAALATAVRDTLADPEAAGKRAAAASRLALRHTWDERAKLILSACGSSI